MDSSGDVNGDERGLRTSTANREPVGGQSRKRPIQRVKFVTPKRGVVREFTKMQQDTTTSSTVCGYDLTGNARRICPECGARAGAGLQTAPGGIVLTLIAEQPRWVFGVVASAMALTVIVQRKLLVATRES